ncbi:hypothetical protein ILUMI_22725 [Ignelater luminosus]|uniref:Uncharacterized protein n=1 Tax=Ignelater luminosus TaxID=2038154 RepID=A0A8K0CA42_IGNLU|nr:hypothetical protein ILUMI_22725 [Ignelater luminosus]
MSSFLMNPVSGAAISSSYQQPQHLATGVVVDPKFPPSEEYSQSNYISSSGGDFFGGHHQPQHHIQYGYHNHHQATTTPYGPTNNGGYGSYGNYYHPQLHSHHAAPLHPHQLRPAIPMHPESQQSHMQCGLQSHQPPPHTPATSSSSLLQNIADVAPSVTQSSDVNSGVCSPASTGHGQDSGGSPAGQHSLQELGLRLEDNGSDEQDDADDDPDGSPVPDDDDDENTESGDRVIYPWMKKIHVAGAGMGKKNGTEAVKLSKERQNRFHRRLATEDKFTSTRGIANTWYGVEDKIVLIATIFELDILDLPIKISVTNPVFVWLRKDKTPLAFIRGSMTAQRNSNGALEPYALSYIREIEHRGFQQHNRLQHFQVNNVNLLPLYIRTLWIHVAWKALSQGDINHPIQRMPRHVSGAYKDLRMIENCTIAFV